MTNSINEIIGIEYLTDMPFDRYEDSVGFIHATGREIFFSDGTSCLEYEGDWTEEIDM